MFNNSFYLFSYVSTEIKSKKEPKKSGTDCKVRDCIGWYLNGRDRIGLDKIIVSEKEYSGMSAYAINFKHVLSEISSKKEPKRHGS